MKVVKISSMPENTQKQEDCKKEWIARARAVGLTSSATKKQVTKAEKE